MRVLFFLAAAVMSCGGEAVDGFRSGQGASNLARFTFECELTQGVSGTLTMDVEAISVTGVTFGSGPNPDITGVIGTGEVTYVTAGDLVSPFARYIFTGRNEFADFSDTGSFERFRVRWLPFPDGLIMEINPFGPGPTQHVCIQTGAEFL
ncbi:MAG: hypothetical protein ACFB9M_08300 [Myxococcota bacterium]